MAVVVGDTLTGVVGTNTRLSAHEWQCDGIWLQTSRSGLFIFNALDENGLSNDEPNELHQKSRQWRIEL